MFSRQENNRFRVSLFEIVVSVILILIFLLLARPFFGKMLENIERTAFQQVIGHLNIAANFKMAEYVALDKLNRLPQELNKNPVTWLGIEELDGWDRYLGEVDSLDFEQLDAQHWVFDKSMSRLIYKVKYQKLLENKDPIENRIQFRLKMDYIDFDENGQFDNETDAINGFRFVPVYPFRWILNEQSATKKLD